MTDPHDHLDDLASAYVDGLSTPAEAARVEADPDVMARVARLRDVRTAVGSADPIPVDEARREAALTAAREAFDEPALVTPIRAARRWPASRRTLAVIGVAAAIALLALVVPLLDRLGPDTSDPSRSEEAVTALDAARDDGAASSDAALPSVPGAASDLGRFADLDDLVAAVRDAVGPPGSELATPTTPAPAAGTTASGAAAPCPEVDDGAPPVYSALAELDARAVVVVVRAAGTEGARELLVLDRADCTVVARAAL